MTMASPSKTRLLNDVYTLLKRRYKLEPRGPRLTILEAVIYGICHEGSTREQANQALSRFKDHFYDWNEVRVSPLQEIRDVLAGFPDAMARAAAIRRFLRQLFEKTYGFNLEALTKKPLKDALKALGGFEALKSDFVQATVIQQALGGHAIPVDVSMRRALARLGIAEAEAEPASLRAMLERVVPKNRGADFGDLMEELSHDTCVAGNPDCPRCELRKVCPTGQERLAAEKQAARTATRATKARSSDGAAKATGPTRPEKAPAVKPRSTQARRKPSK
jgi:endonuclease III